jgi:hypothetical protein
MKRTLTIIILCLCLTAQAETGRIYLTLTAAVKLSEAKAISFGSLITTGEATVTISPTGDRTVTGEITTPDNIYSEGAFGVTGAPSSAFVVTFCDGSATNGKSTITVDNFKTNLAGNVGTTDGSGKAMFSVGGTAHIGLSNNSGAYVGSYTVTAAYQ